MKKVRIKQTKSLIDRTERQRNTLAALGLKGVGKTVEHTLTPQIKGMLKKVSHLVEVENI